MLGLSPLALLSFNSHTLVGRIFINCTLQYLQKIGSWQDNWHKRVRQPIHGIHGIEQKVAYPLSNSFPKYTEQIPNQKVRHPIHGIRTPNLSVGSLTCYRWATLDCMRWAQLQPFEVCCTQKIRQQLGKNLGKWYILYKRTCNKLLLIQIRTYSKLS